MKIKGLGHIAFYRFFGLFKGGILGSKRKSLVVYKINSRDLTPCIDVFLKHIKR